MGEKDIPERVAVLEGLYKEVSMKREEVFFLNAKFVAEMDDMRDTMKEVHSAVVGNESIGHLGIVKEMTLFKKRIDELETIIDKLKIIIAKVGAIGGVIGFVLAFFIERVLKWLF